MKISSAERQKAYRERKKQEKLERLKSPSVSENELFLAPFSDWVSKNPNYTEVELALGLIGFEAPGFHDERGPREFALPEALGPDNEAFSEADNALGRAEVIIGCLLTATIEMAGIVNEYKREQIENRLAELEHSEAVDKKAAMKEAVKLNKLLDRFDKPVRWALPEWKDA
tara:strand:+ start:2190 stop:2702 length:513 start_codon:yes stop_codon:yes gene_type:complete